MKQYSLQEVADAIGVSRECVKAWMYKGYIKRGAWHPPGARKAAVYSEKDLADLKLFKALMNFGFKIGSVAKYIDKPYYIIGDLNKLLLKHTNRL
ncbi:hypothetical protein DRO91_06080 [Candidatus Heimdallarchaeota archaeon]|nr:MAG: hypothetical protein DRO91_06080 [Candidatus Heimdallarchaeota archaeon]